jgi:hypothetical protein
MTLTEFYNEVSRRTDTNGTKINVAETKRCLSEAFLVLSKMSTGEALDLMAKGIKKASSK